MTPQVQVLPSDFLDRFSDSIKRFSKLTEKSDDATDLEAHLFEKEREGVEVRAFPCGPDGGPRYPVSSIHFEVIVDESVDWYDDSLGAYSADNLRNGGPIYEALADELEGAVVDAGLPRPAFVKGKGSGAFTAEVEV